MKKINLLLVILTFLMATVSNSCKYTTNKSKKASPDSYRDQKSPELIAKDKLIEEKKMLKQTLDTTLKEFNRQLTSIENDIEEGDVTLKKDTREMLDILLHDRDSLSYLKMQIDTVSKGNWVRFNTELEYDIKQFRIGANIFFNTVEYKNMQTEKQ